jgi:hypothetical protein
MRSVGLKAAMLLFAPIVLLAVVVVGALVTEVNSLPRLALEHAAACNTCHINPNGGGQRTEFGNHSVAYNELCLPQTKHLLSGKVKAPRLGELLTAGFDTRHLVFDDGYIFRMQTDAFLTFSPYKDFRYHLRLSDNVTGSGIAENYGLITFDDERHYIKAGRFYPAFGLRNADHNAFNRTKTGHGSTLYLDGLSLGMEFHGTKVALELFDANRRGVYGVHVFRPGYIAPFGYLIGGSLRLSEKLAGTNGSFPHAKSLFGGLSYDRYSLLGEVDLVGQANDSLVVYGQLVTRIEYGLYLIGEYNFFDSDRNLKSGSEEFWRFSIELFPIPFVELRPSYTYYSEGPLKDRNDFFLQVHLGY